MIYLEMSRNELHGGGTWEFPKCVWAPTQKRNGAGSWPFWNKILRISEGDVIFHLRGVSPNASFVGYSIASSNGFETKRRPPNPGKWNYSRSFYRADLDGFVRFHREIRLADVFAAKRRELEEYSKKNKTRKRERLNVFFVKQGGRLQCLNGAYLSDVDDDLCAILFRHDGNVGAGHGSPKRIVSVETGEQLAIANSRIGQAKFRTEVKKRYSNMCCFPGCTITDSRFLIAAHIARWTDNKELRGDLGNGLCFCLMHDKAFERGLFTLDKQFQVFVNPAERGTETSFLQELVPAHGKTIRLADIEPLLEALHEHWHRVDIDPSV